MRMQTGADPIMVRWFRVPATRPYLAGPSPFRSRVDSLVKSVGDDLGEVWPDPADCDQCEDRWAACPPTAYDGRTWCGSSQSWQYGDTQGAVEIFTTGELGFAPCCDKRPPCGPPPYSIFAPCCCLFPNDDSVELDATWNGNDLGLSVTGTYPSTIYEFQSLWDGGAFTVFYEPQGDGSVNVEVGGTLSSLAPATILPAGGDPCHTTVSGFTIPSVQGFNPISGMVEIHALVVTQVPGAGQAFDWPGCVLPLPKATQVIIDGCPLLNGTYHLGFTWPNAFDGFFAYTMIATGGCQPDWSITILPAEQVGGSPGDMRLLVTAGTDTAVLADTSAVNCSGTLASWTVVWNSDNICTRGTVLTFTWEAW